MAVSQKSAVPIAVISIAACLLSVHVFGLPFPDFLRHVDRAHLFGNLVALFAVGPSVERTYGASVVAFLVIVGGGFSNHIAVLLLSDPAGSVVGASGGVSALLGAGLVAHQPRRNCSGDASFVVLASSWIAIQIIFAFSLPGIGPISWTAHLVGLAFGLLFGTLAFCSVRFARRFRRT